MSVSAIEEYLLGPLRSRVVFGDYYQLEDMADQFQDAMARSGVFFTPDEALIAAMTMQVIGSAERISAMPPGAMQKIALLGKVFHEGELESDPYYRTIRFDERSLGNFRLAHGYLEKYEIFSYGESVESEGLSLPCLGTVDYRFRYPCITEEDELWMSLTPGELQTMKQPVREARGKVLTLGLGMGYYTFMAAEKGDVSHVTVVERSDEVIRLFETVILPQFPHREKVTVVKSDAVDYLRELKDGEFDYCFADLWQDENDADLFRRYEKEAARFRRMRCRGWIERTMRKAAYGSIPAE